MFFSYRQKEMMVPEKEKALRRRVVLNFNLVFAWDWGGKGDSVRQNCAGFVDIEGYIQNGGCE